jgi:hypothetical protein
VLCAASAFKLHPLDNSLYSKYKVNLKREIHKEYIANGHKPLSYEQIVRHANTCLLEVLTHLPAFVRHCGIVGAPAGTPIVLPTAPATSTALPFAAPIAGAPAPKKIRTLHEDSDADSSESESGSDAVVDLTVGKQAPQAGSARSKQQAGILKLNGTGEHFLLRRVASSQAAAGSESLLRAAVRGLVAGLDARPRDNSGVCTGAADRAAEDAAVESLRQDVAAAAPAGRPGARAAAQALTALATARAVSITVLKRFLPGSASLSRERCV